MQPRNRRANPNRRPAPRLTHPVRLAALLVLLAAVLTGCVKGEAAVTVRAAGSLDVSAVITVPAAQMQAVEPVINTLSERLRGAGFDAAYERTGPDAVWRIARHYSRDELRSSADELQLDEEGYRLRFKRERRLLYDRLVLDGALQPNELLAGNHPLLAEYNKLPALVRRLAERQVSLGLTVTLPIPPVSHNGQSSNFGRTIAWRVSPSAETPVQAALALPNAGTYLAGGLLLAAAAAGIVLLRRRRKGRGRPR